MFNQRPETHEERIARIVADIKAREAAEKAEFDAKIATAGAELKAWKDEQEAKEKAAIEASAKAREEQRSKARADAIKSIATLYGITPLAAEARYESERLAAREKEVADMNHRGSAWVGGRD